MSLEHGDSSRSSSTAKRHITSHDDVQNESISLPSSWIRMEKKEVMIPLIFQHFVWPEWLFYFSVVWFIILVQDLIVYFERIRRIQEKLTSKVTSCRGRKQKLQTVV
jgi:hypothetical protein